MEDKPMFGAGSAPTKLATRSTGFLRSKDHGPTRLPKVIPPLVEKLKAAPPPPKATSAADRKPKPLYHNIAPSVGSPAGAVAPDIVPQPAPAQPMSAMPPTQAAQMAQPVAGSVPPTPVSQPTVPPAVPPMPPQAAPVQPATCPASPEQTVQQAPTPHAPCPPVQPAGNPPAQPHVQQAQPQPQPGIPPAMPLTQTAQPVQAIAGTPVTPAAPTMAAPAPCPPTSPASTPGVVPPAPQTPQTTPQPPSQQTAQQSGQQSAALTAGQAAQQPINAQTVANPAATIPQQIAPLQPNGSIDDRLYQRKRTLKGGMIILPGQMMSSYACRIRNESMGGVCLVLPAAPEMPNEFYLMRDGDPGHKIPCRVAWRGLDRLGVQFIQQLTCDIPVVG